MKRIFVAVKTAPSAEFLEMYSSVRALLGKERITWVSIDNIHITLVFLGDTEENMIREAGIKLKQACTGFGEFSFTLAGTGVFRNFRDARVIWAGINDAGKITELQDQIAGGLKVAGFKIEDREFNPHVTLGRIKEIREPDKLKSVVESYNNTFFQEVGVREVILYESILKPDGPVYHSLGRFELA